MCHLVPTTGAIVSSILYSKTKQAKHGLLMILFIGSSLFGVIDHWWNGELFLVSENILSDLSLGITIALATVICWGIILKVSQNNPVLYPKEKK